MKERSGITRCHNVKKVCTVRYWLSAELQSCVVGDKTTRKQRPPKEATDHSHDGRRTCYMDRLAAKVLTYRVTQFPTISTGNKTSFWKFCQKRKYKLFEIEKKCSRRTLHFEAFLSHGLKFKYDNVTDTTGSKHTQNVQRHFCFWC